MPLPAPQDQVRQPASRDLPADYRNPWQTLGENLQAVRADLRLRSQELWRRNREGSLWHPGWWPLDLAPLFFPLLIALGLGLCTALIAIGVMALNHRPVGPSPATTSPAEATASPAEFSAAPELSALQPAAPFVPDVESVIPDATATSDPTVLAEPDTVADSVDPLSQLLHRPGAEEFLLRADGRSDRATLVLEVAQPYQALSAPEQLRRALEWQQWAEDLGYDHLELRDSRAGLLARDALVGGGMIVLSEATRP